MTEASRSGELFARARDVLPGGVSSPVRAFGAVGGVPRFIVRGSGARIWDVDGREYLDLVMSWGPLLHGHAHPTIVSAVLEATQGGTSFGAPTEVEVKLGMAIQRLFPSMQRLRFVNSGTEATLSVLRLARAHTGRDVVVKFAGCYHGHVDALLVKAGSGALTHGQPTSKGIPSEVAETTRVLPYNDLVSLQKLFSEEGEQIAAVIVEPVAGNMGVVAGQPEFVALLRRLTESAGSLLVFDEVITGLRLGPGGAQEMFGIRPDLTILGKIVGGGLPAAVFGGSESIMALLSPEGPVYQAGTLSGNPLAMSAGLASVELAAFSDYAYLTRLATVLGDGLIELGRRYDVPITVNRCRSMLSCFFTPGPVNDLESAQRSDTSRYARFFHAMLDSGVYLPPSQFETWMLSFAHQDSDLELILMAADRAFTDVASGSAG